MKKCIFCFVFFLFVFSVPISSQAQETMEENSSEVSASDTKATSETKTEGAAESKTEVSDETKTIPPVQDSPTSSVPAPDSTRSPMTISETSSLPLRVLTRPMASLYKDETGQTVLESNLPAFQAYFVYTLPQGEARITGTGWYEVGTDDKGTIAGWFKGDDVFEWKQAMCLAFKHPEGRKPVLMFDYEEALDGLVTADATKRAADVQTLYADIEKAAAGASLPEDFPVLSVEPKMAVDISKQFYLLPILEHKAISLDGREGRMLRIAAVSASGAKARESSDIRTNQDELKALTAETASQAQKLENLKVDVVWVVDTTRSMGPFITSAREAIQKAATSIAKNPKLNDKIAFGVWAYRDSTTIQDIGYNTKNFTPALQNLDAFLATMADVKETKTDSVDMAEDMFAGVHDAITKTAWRPESLRFIMLIGDAPAHADGHKWNSSKQSEETLNGLLKGSKITLMAMHIKPQKTRKYNRIAAKQMTAISNSRDDKPLYTGIAGRDMKRYAELSEQFTASIVSFVDASMEVGKTGDSKEILTTQSETASPKIAFENAIRAAAVEWLGSQAEAQAPRDIEAWITDKDLTDPTKQAMEVRILLNKRQLDSLKTLLDEVITAGMETQISADDFFTSLQAASAVAARNPDMLVNATSLGQAGMIPDFLEGLPYHSQLMDMNNELWASWGPDEQQSFLDKLASKVAAYASIHDTPALWVALNKGDDPSEHVAPVMLELMP